MTRKFATGGFGNRRQAGFTLLEILVTLVIVTLGLLGVAALQGRAVAAETEAYQRVQATAILQDLVDRITANRNTTACFVQDFGTGAVPSPCGGAAGVDQGALDSATAAITAWHDLLLGVTELSAAGAAVGGLPNARGCVVRDRGTETVYHLAVAWQGLAETSVPAAPIGATAALTNAVACGSGQYGASDAARRVIWTTIRIPALD
jgi:type IV pilus assembly protein PilV